MIPELSDQQRQALQENPKEAVQVFDPTTQSQYVIIPAKTYQRLRALLEVDEFDVREAYPHADAVAKREGWDDPAMDAYDQLDPRRKS